MSYLNIQQDNKNGIVKLMGDDVDVIRAHFSQKNPAKRAGGYKARFIPDRLYAITDTGRVPSGMVPEIIKYVNNNLPGTTIDLDKGLLANQGFKSVCDDVAVLPNIELRPYQNQAVKKCLAVGRGIVLHPTAAGKSVVIGSLALSLSDLITNVPILILVPDIGLAQQMTDDLTTKFGLQHDQVIKWTGSTPINQQQSFDGVKFVIANYKIAWLNKELVKSKFANTPGVIIDEVHTVTKGTKINGVLDLLVTQHRFGFTGTLPDKSIDAWNIMGRIGPVIALERTSDLEQQEYIARVRATIVNVYYNEPIDYSPPLDLKGQLTGTMRYQAEITQLYSKPFRNNVIAALANKGKRPALILVDRLEAARDLVDNIRNMGDNIVHLITGDVAIDVREQIKQEIEDNNDIILVAIDKIFRMGISIDNVHTIILASLGKAKAGLIQSIGRGRRKHERKDKLHLIDIADQTTYAMAHTAERLKVYDSEGIPYATHQIKQ